VLLQFASFCAVKEVMPLYQSVHYEFFVDRFSGLSLIARQDNVEAYYKWARTVLLLVKENPLKRCMCLAQAHFIYTCAWQHVCTHTHTHVRHTHMYNMHARTRAHTHTTHILHTQEVLHYSTYTTSEAQASLSFNVHINSAYSHDKEWTSI